MIVQEEFLKKLRSAFNLNIYEVKIWTALLSKGIATAGELSDISNVPRSRSYDVLEGLEKKGFVIMKLGKPIRYIAVEPKEVVKRVKDRIKTKSERQLQGIEDTKKTQLFKDTELLFKQGITHVDPATLSGALRGRDAIYNHLETMLGNAEKSVTIMTSPTGFIRKVNSLEKHFKRLNKKGVQIRIATPFNDEIKNLLKEVDFLKAKNIDKINARFIIVDKKELIFMTSDDKDVHESYDLGIWVNTPFFASALENLFDMTWNKLK